MQRLGFCKAVLAFSGLAKTTTQMSNILKMKLETQVFPLPYDEGRDEWLKSVDKNYKNIPESKASLQKLYIYNHPSRTGWLSPLHGFDEYVDFLPNRLGIVKNSCDPTDMGLALAVGLMSTEHREAFNAPSTLNPLVLTLGEQIFFLYNILTVDGDFFIPLYEKLFNKFANTDFDYLAAGSLIPSVIDDIVNRFSGSAYSRPQWEELDRLKKTKETILGEIDNQSHRKGSGTRREHVTVTRLEWLVDLGLAKRAESKVTRMWHFTDAGLKLGILTQFYINAMSRMYPENVVGSLLDTSFFEYINKVYSKVPYVQVDREQFIPFMWQAHKTLAGPGGYSLLRPALLYANILSLTNQRGLYLEHSEAFKLLESTYQTDPTAIHYTIDRFNTDYQFKINKE
jgi:hypothetical protein